MMVGMQFYKVRPSTGENMHLPKEGTVGKESALDWGRASTMNTNIFNTPLCTGLHAEPSYAATVLFA